MPITSLVKFLNREKIQMLGIKKEEKSSKSGSSYQSESRALVSPSDYSSIYFEKFSLKRFYKW